MKIINTNNYINTNIQTQTNKSIRLNHQIKFSSQPIKPIKSKFLESFKKFMSPYSKFVDKIKTKIAHGLAKILETKAAENIIRKTRNNNMVAHLSALTGVVLSGFYIKKTLENDKFDIDKKMTLAINQGIVCVFSTVAAYTLDKITNKKTEKFIDKYWATHLHESQEKLYVYKNGINAAKKIMVFGLVYRFIAPVLATPIANHLGNKMQDKREAELAKKNKINSSNSPV